MAVCWGVFEGPTNSSVGRFGYKKTYVTFWGIRSFVLAFLLLTPAVLARNGTNGAFVWVTVIVLDMAIQDSSRHATLAGFLIL